MYVPSLDGIRACAVLGVLAVHGGAHINGGFIGVDIFFVLSGFLITSLLLQEWDLRARISLGAFYVRRARRLLPALAVALIAVSVLFATVPDYYHGGVKFEFAAIAALFYCANWVAAFMSGNHQGALGPLTHTWSLSIEEQFYVLWPAVLLLCLRQRVSPRNLLASLILLAVLSAADRGALWAFHVGGDPYYRTDTHADGILIGCALAVARGWSVTADSLRRLLRSAWLATAACALLLGVALAATLHSTFLFVGGYLVIAIAAAAVIGHLVIAERSFWSRLFAHRILRWVGERSYGIYLFHLPIFFLLSKDRLRTPLPVAFAAEIAVTFAVAAASYRFIELPFLKKKRATEPKELPPNPPSHDSSRELSVSSR